MCSKCLPVHVNILDTACKSTYREGVLGRCGRLALDMDFLTLLWAVVATLLFLGLLGTGLVMSFWVRCDQLADQKASLQRQLEIERADRADLVSNLMELQAALRAEKFHVEQLQRKIQLLQLPFGHGR